MILILLERGVATWRDWAAQKAAAPELTVALAKHSNVTIARSLWKITRQPEPSLTVLIKAISGNVDLSNADTHFALEGLADLGPLARPALPALIVLHRRADAYHREEIQQFAAKIDPETAKKMAK